MQAGSSIAFLCHPYHRGGVTTWMVDMAAECAARGNKVYFVTVDPKKEFHSAGGRQTMVSLLGEHGNVHLVTKKVGWSFEFGTMAYRSGVYRELLRSCVPAGTPVILADDIALWHTAQLCGGGYRFVGVLHSDEEFYYKQAAAYRSFISVFVCVSGRVSSKLAAHCSDIPANKIFTIPCGIPLPQFSPVKNETGEMKLVYVGRVGDYQKRVSDLVKIALELRTRGTPFHLDIIGDGGQRPAIEQKFADAGLKEKVSFLGWLSKKEIFHHLFRSDLLLLVSDFEGMPIVVMEALAAGCGVISTRVSGVEDYEQIPEAKNCLWVNSVGNIEEAVGNIGTAIKVPFEVRIVAARNLCKLEFDISTCYDRYTRAIAACSAVNGIAAQQKSNYTGTVFSIALSCIRYIKLKLNS